MERKANDVFSDYMENLSLATDSELLKDAILSGQKARILQLLQEKNIDIKAIHFAGDSVLHLVFRNSKLSADEIIEILGTFIDQGVDPNVRNNQQETVLHVALKTWNIKIVDYLLKHNAKIDVTDNQGNSLLHSFFQNLSKCLTEKHLNYRENDPALKIQLDEEKKSADFVEWLLSKGFDCDCKNKNGQSALHLAIEYNLQHILPTLLKHTRDINSRSEYDNQTLLQLFLKANNTAKYVRSYLNPFVALSRSYDKEIVKIMLERGISVDHEDRFGRTAIHFAVHVARNGADMDIVEMLFDRFTKISDESGYLLLCKVIESSMLAEVHSHCYNNILTTLMNNWIHLLNDRQIGWQPICSAVVYRNFRAIDMMKRNNVNFNIITKDDNNMLHKCVNGEFDDDDDDDEQENLIDFLVSQGCEVNGRNLEGETPLHLAVRKNCNIADIGKLIEHGAEINSRDTNGRTPLEIAVQRESFDAMDLLLAKGANINGKNRNGRRLIHLMAASEKTTMLQILLIQGAEVNARDSSGNSALATAIIADSTGSLNKLLEFGADVNDISIEQLAPPQLAANVTFVALMRHCYKLRSLQLPYPKEFKVYKLRPIIPRQFRKTCKGERDKLKGILVDAQTSFYQWLRMNCNRRYSFHTRNDKLRSLIDSPTLVDEFPEYSTVILGRYRESEGRRRLLEQASEAFVKFIGFHLSDICIEHIFSYLNNGYLLEIIEIAEGSKV